MVASQLLIVISSPSERPYEQASRMGANKKNVSDLKADIVGDHETQAYLHLDPSRLSPAPLEVQSFLGL